MNSQARGLLEGAPPAPVSAAPPWVAVTGGKGGVGKTLIAVNLAISLVKLGHKTLLVDLDPGLGNVDVHLRLSARFDIEHVAEGACASSDAVLDGPAQLAVLLGRSGSTRLCDGNRGFLGKVLAGVARAAQGFDVVVCDTGAGIGPAVLATVARATAALAVTTPDPAATTDTYALCKLLAQRGKRLPWLVVNRAASTAQAHKVAVHLAAVCERFLGKAPPLLGVVRSDPAFERSVVEQRPVCLSAPELADELRRLSCGVMEAVTRQVEARQSHAWARSTQTA